MDGCSLVKNGFTKQGTQRYLCKNCRKSFQKNYKHQAYLPYINQSVSKLLCEGVGIRGISRLLSISTNTVLRRIIAIASKIPNPILSLGKEYEVDELCTFIGNKKQRRWITYALRKDTKEVVCYQVGRRNKTVVKRLVDTLLNAYPKKIYTDHFRVYRYIIPSTLHKTKKFGTNHIERMNLTLRTHLKRLSRRSICYTKSHLILSASLRIYFWGAYKYCGVLK